MNKEYVQPILFITALSEEDVVRASVFEDGDHIVQPGSNWGSGALPQEKWSDWF